jgi:hypothetical protein
LHFYVPPHRLEYRFVSNTGVTIFALQVATTFSVFFLGEVVLDAFDFFRWYRAAQVDRGLGAATFLALARATSLWGVLRLSFSKQKVGHHKWCLQRYTPHSPFLISSILFDISRLVLTVILLFNIDSRADYRRTTPNQNIIAGAAPFDVTYSSGRFPGV